MEIEDKNIFEEQPEFWGSLSKENLKTASGIVTSVINFIELGPQFYGLIKIPKNKFLDQEEAVFILSKVPDIRVRNREIRESLLDFERRHSDFYCTNDVSVLLGGPERWPTKDDLLKNIYLKIYSLNGLKMVQEIAQKSNPITTRSNGSRSFLPKFPRTEWPKVKIIFTDDRHVVLSDGKKNVAGSFDTLGCEDGRTGRANSAWGFLRGTALGGGVTSPIAKQERERIKKHKQVITDILRTIFENQTDPFESLPNGIYQARFSIKYSQQETNSKKFSDIEEIYDEMTS